MPNHRSASMKNRFAKSNLHKQKMSIAEYIERKQEWENLPGRITADGRYEILFHGHWITPEELEEVFPKPFVHTFTQDITNCDTRKLWMT